MQDSEPSFRYIQMIDVSFETGLRAQQDYDRGVCRVDNRETELNLWVNQLGRILELGELVLSCPWQPTRLEQGHVIDPMEISPLLLHLQEREDLFHELQELPQLAVAATGVTQHSSSHVETDVQQTRIRKLMVQVVEQNEQIAGFVGQNMENIRHAQNHLLFTQRMKSGYQSALRFARPGLAINDQA